MDIFQFDDYKKFVNFWVENTPGKGRGTYRKLANHLNINSVMISQIFRGARDLTSEQALSVAEFVGLNEIGTEYFILLVQKERASTHNYKLRIDQKIEKILQDSKEIKNRFQKDSVLTDEAKSVFYSRWFYSATRLAASIPEMRSAEMIAQKLNLPVQTISQVIEFLLQFNLCVQDEYGNLQMGPQTTHIGSDSRLVGRHHLNWRLKAIQKIDAAKSDDLFFTSPMALSQNAFNLIRGELINSIEKNRKIAVDSESEDLSCLIIDWFKI